MVVTAAGSGMGRAGAILFARQGARICIVDYDTTAAQEVAPVIVLGGGAAHANLASVDEACEAVHASATLVGGLDGLAHAGSASPKGITDITARNTPVSQT